MEIESVETFVLKCTCPHEVPVSCNISISLPVNMTTFQELSLKGCRNCANSMVELGLAIQENICQDTDRQVGLGMLGLANLLRRYGITYEQFGVALDNFNAGEVVRTPAYELVSAIASGVDAAAEIARANNMVRAFAIAPTASCSYRSTDLDGFTSTPEIAPPISRTVDRDSGTFGVQTYNYGDVEIASEVGWENYKRVADGIMTLLNRTGLLHGYSFNSWSDVVTYDNAFIEEWLEAPDFSLLQPASNGRRTRQVKCIRCIR